MNLDNATLFARTALHTLPGPKQDAYRAVFIARLERAVGDRLAEAMSEAQLAHFDHLSRRDGRLADAWLHVHFPHYRQVAAQEFQRLHAELVAQADEILTLELGYER
jgi:hypothetical protein